MNPNPEAALVGAEDDGAITPVLCPSCGSADLQWVELVPEIREVVGIRAGQVVIRDHGQTLWQEGQDTHIECLTCFHEFSPDAVHAPRGYDYDD